MKVLFNSCNPFFLAHGGAQVQIEQTKAGLEAVGVDVEYLRWWDDQQKGDIIHSFGVASTGLQGLARKKNVRVVSTVFLSQTCNRPLVKLCLQAIVTRCILAMPFGNSVKDQLTWKSFIQSDCSIVGLNAERRVLKTVYGVEDSRIKSLPIGCESEFLEALSSERRGDYLVAVGTITAQKRSVELAKMATKAGVPILFIGKPYSECDPSWLQFKQIGEGNPYVRYKVHVSDRKEMIGLLQQARGFVHFSTFENWCIAADEAAACGLPLLLPDQKWARERFGASASFFPGNRLETNARCLRQFFEESPRLPLPPKPVSWVDVALRLKGIYEEVLSTSR